MASKNLTLDDMRVGEVQRCYGKTICPFGEAVAWPVRSFVEKFKDEFLQCIIKEEVVA